MVSLFCNHKLDELGRLVLHQQTSILILCVLHLIFSLVATLGNLLVIHALLKVSTTSATIKQLLLSLAFADLALGLFVHQMAGVVFAVMLRMAANGNYNFDILCPTILTVCYFVFLVLGVASFLNIIAIAVDRLLAISFHLRYQELITSKRVVKVLVSLWLTSVVVATIYVSLHDGSHMVVACIEFVGLLVTFFVYIRIFRVVRHHQNQIQIQLQLENAHAMQLLREKKNVFNALFVYVVFLACYLPYLCSAMFLITNGSRVSFLVAEQVSAFLLFFNSSLNPLVYCWRYPEIRNIVLSTLKKILRLNDTGT